MPNEKANPSIGEPCVLESVVEEKIETVCFAQDLETIIQVIKDIHPYESTIIEIYPIYKIGCK